MSRCTCGRETNHEVHGTIPKLSTSETLPIVVGRVKPPCLAPGASRLYCYWKITIYIDIARKNLDLYVPPEWRSLTPALLEDWTNQLRDQPFTDIILGKVMYHWSIDVLLPSRQDYRTVPIHGRNGWPSLIEPVPLWNKPRLAFATDRLPITINRAPLLPCLGMENVVCYWRMLLPRTVEPRRYVWVPPEWRKLTDKTRRLWARRLGANPDQPIVLGRTHYYWENNTIIPHGQNPVSIEYLGLGRYRHVEPNEEGNNGHLDIRPKHSAPEPDLVPRVPRAIVQPGNHSLTPSRERLIGSRLASFYREPVDACHGYQRMQPYAGPETRV